MHPACRQTILVWVMLAKGDDVPKENLSEAVWVGITREPPPPGIEAINNAIDMCRFMYLRETGRELSGYELQELRKYAIEVSSVISSGWRVGIFVATALPWTTLFLAIFSVWLAGMSWIVVGLAVFGKVWNGFARWLGAQLHPSASFHFIVSIASLIGSIGASVSHLFGWFSLP